jgi:hypothetical protein
MGDQVSSLLVVQRYADAMQHVASDAVDVCAAVLSAAYRHSFQF